MNPQEKVATNTLLVHRDKISVAEGAAGVPVSEYFIPMPIFQRLHHGLSGQSELYDAICKKYNGKRTSKVLAPLFVDIKKKGILQAAPGFKLRTKTELYGGHHRAAIAAVLGIPALLVDVHPLDPLILWKCDIGPIITSYKQLQAATTLADKCSYNPIPGFKAQREGYDRLALIYQEVINAKGTMLLDAGCNDGFFGAFMTSRCFDVTFLDSLKPCLDVCRARTTVMRSKAAIGETTFVQADLPQWLEKTDMRYSVTLALDVLQHVAFKATNTDAQAALAKCLAGLLRVTTEKLIVSFGNWDALRAHGVSDAVMYSVARKHGWRIRFLGCPTDYGPYTGREVYVLHP